MEVLKVITRAKGGYDYIDKGTNYLFDDRCIKLNGYGISPYDQHSAAMQLKQNASFWNNQNKNPFIQSMISFSTETATTAEEAMRLTEEIHKPFTDEHLLLSGSHKEQRKGSEYHTHTFIHTTNINNGSMIHADNKTTFNLAQRVADITGQPVKLIVSNEQNKEWECPKLFTPKHDDDNK